MITLEQAKQWQQKYCNVKIIDKHGEQFRVEIRDLEGILIWREWNFESCHTLIQYVHDYGKLREAVEQGDNYAHLVSYPIADNKFYMVVITKDAKMEPGKHYNGILAANMRQAFDIAAQYNAPLMQGDTQLLEGNFK